jgi:multidrug transporter EmrE-like cation transporter
LRAESSSFFEGATSLLRIFFLALLIIAIVGLKITA